MEATEQPSLSITRCLFLVTLKPDLISFSCCQSASKVHQSIFSAEIFLPCLFLSVLHCSSTCSLQLLSQLICDFRTLQPREQGTLPLTSIVDSLQDLQGKQREQHFAFLSSSVEQELLAQLSLFFFTMDKSSTVFMHFLFLLFLFRVLNCAIESTVLTPCCLSLPSP